MVNVIHQPQQGRFVVIQDGKEATLAYRVSDSTINFYNTYVPTEFRGQGIAEMLVRTGMVWAKEQGYGITASCWYAAKFL